MNNENVRKILSNPTKFWKLQRWTGSVSNLNDLPSRDQKDVIRLLKEIERELEAENS